MTPRPSITHPPLTCRAPAHSPLTCRAPAHPRLVRRPLAGALLGALLGAAALESCTSTGPLYSWPGHGTGAGPEPEFQFSDAKAWRVAGSGELVLLGGSRYRPKVRSPLCIALVDGREFGDFVFDVEAMQTGRDVPHRDLCFFFGVESATRYYYVHIAKRADKNAHNVFRVADAPRTNIAETTTKGVDWGEGVWHRIRIERQLASGAIRVYFDDMAKPIMTATDKTHGWGMLGVGSFDDSGRFRNLRVRGGGMRRTTRKVFE